MAVRTIDRLDVVSLAKILGVMGLLWGIVIAITWAVTGILGGSGPGGTELALSIIGGVLYGVIGGAVTAIVYNAAAGIVGGVELELSEARSR